VADRIPVLNLALPMLAALIVTAGAIRLAGPVTGNASARVLIPPLVAFLPGRAPDHRGDRAS
jgi:hypothetical protein